MLRLLTELAATVFMGLAIVSVARLDAFAATGDEQDDVQVIAGRLVMSLLPADQAGVAAAVKAGRDVSETLLDDGSWPDIDYAGAARSNWQAASHLHRLQLMAIACRLAQGDPSASTLRTKTLLALSFWLDHDYQNPNWWWNEIGTPQAIGRAAILMRDSLTPDQMQKTIKILDRSVLSMTGANLTWVASNAIVKGCLERRPDIIAQAYSRLYQEIKIAGPDEEGIQEDYSFHQHGAQIYSGGYGRQFEADCVRNILSAWGTKFQIPPDRLAIFVKFQLEGQQWMMRGAQFDYNVIGRELTRREDRAPDYASVPAAGPLPATTIGLASVETSSRTDLLAYAERRACIASAAPLSGSRAYWLSDYVAHQRPGYFVGLRMCSSRMRNGETVNGEGLKSRYLSYGATFIYRTGNEYHNIFPVWNWRRIPGTTVEQDDASLLDSVNDLGAESFAGGASDGRFAVAAQDLKLGHVAGRKAWFFFDDGLVALGAALSCPTGNSLITCVNQCLQNGEETSGTLPDPQQTGGDSADCRWVVHDGVGYVFPLGGAVSDSTGPQTGRWSDIGSGSSQNVTADVFSLTIDHGTQARDASYAYEVLPGWKPSQLQQTLRRFKIVANTSDAQAVFDADADVLQVVFWKAGVVDNDGAAVGADRPCLALVDRRGREAVLTAASPDHAAGRVHITLPGRWHGAGARPGAGSTVVAVDLPAGLDAGRSVSVALTQ